MVLSKIFSSATPGLINAKKEEHKFGPYELKNLVSMKGKLKVRKSMFKQKHLHVASYFYLFDSVTSVSISIGFEIPELLFTKYALHPATVVMNL